MAWLNDDMITAYKYLKGVNSKEEELFQVMLNGI